MNVLIVCTGNTCRSPMAEGLLKKIADNDDSVHVLSGGLFANAGEPVSENAARAMAERGIDISAHTAKNIHAAVVQEADLILTMTQAHEDLILRMFGVEAADKTYTLLEYIGEEGDVVDPFGQDLEHYRQCAAMLNDALQKVYDKIRSENGGV